MKVNRIFYSLQGEGVYQGVPMAFIRLQGCNMLPRCSYCDTSYAQDPGRGKEMSIQDVMDEVGRFSGYKRYSWVCITGGEPLWQKDELETLVRALKMESYRLTIETNGSFPVPGWYGLVDSWSADMKCPSSGVAGSSKEDWFKTRIFDQVKFVVSDIEDLEFTRDVMKRHLAASPTILVSPSAHILVNKKEGLIEEYWNKEWLREVAEFCKKERVRMSLQYHKIIWGDKEGV